MSHNNQKERFTVVFLLAFVKIAYNLMLQLARKNVAEHCSSPHSFCFFHPMYLPFANFPGFGLLHPYNLIAI